MLGHEFLQLNDELLMTAELEVGGDPFLLRRQAKLLETRDLGLREVLVPELGERRSAPERERRAESLGGRLGVTPSERTPALLHAGAEQVCVQPLGLDAEAVAVAMRLERAARGAEI